MIRFSNGTKTTSPQNSIAQIGIILFISSVEDGILILGFNLKVSGGAGGYCPHRFSHSIKTLVLLLLLLLLLLLHTIPYIYSLVLLRSTARGHSTAEVFKLCFLDVQCDSHFTSNTETAHFSYAQAQG
jgi:hypothetical protein